MLFKLIGAQHQTGDFQGKPFDNYNLYLVNLENKAVNSFGLVPQSFTRNQKARPYLSVKAAVMHSLVAPDQIDKIIGKTMNIDFDMYGNASKIVIQ